MKMIPAAEMLLLAIFSGLVLSCEDKSKRILSTSPEPSATSRPVQDVALQRRADELNQLYAERNCNNFVVGFPDTFEEFDRLYGYDDEIGPRRSLRTVRVDPVFIYLP